MGASCSVFRGTTASGVWLGMETPNCNSVCGSLVPRPLPPEECGEWPGDEAMFVGERPLYFCNYFRLILVPCNLIFANWG